MDILRASLIFLTALLLAATAVPAGAQAPSYQDKGAPASGTNGVSPAWPAHQVGDVAFLVMETRGNVTPTLLTANGFASVGSNNAVNSAAGTRLTVFWARATSTSMAAPVINNTTDHVYAQILTYRGVLWAGNPWSATATGNKTTASMSANVTGVTPTDTNSLVVQIATRPNDSAAAFVTGLVNANLTGITVRSDEGTTVGDGGGFAIWDGVRATAVATGTTAATFNVSVVNAFRALALRPARYFSAATGPWNTAATWSTAGCGGAASSVVPPAGADVTVCDGHTVTQDVNSANLNSLTIQSAGILNIGNSGTARTLTVSPTAPLPAGTIVNNGILRYNTAANHVITTNGTFTNNGTFTSAAVTGTKTLTATGLITNSGTGVFRFAGGAVTTVNANGGFVNDGTLDVDAASNVTHVINMRGDFTNNGTVNFRPDANSFVTTVFNATAAQTLTGTAGNTSFYNATISNANGVTLTGTHNMTVLNVLNFTVDGSIITTGTNLVQIGDLALNLVGNVTNANANRFVNGNLQRYFTAAATLTFDVGSIGPNRWSPVQVQLGVAPSTDGSLRVSTASGDHAQIGASGFDANKTVNRTWTLTNAGLVFGANANNRVRFAFVAGDIDGTAVTANFHIGRYTGAWTLTPPPVPNAQPLFTEIAGTTITSAVLAGDFQVGEKGPSIVLPGRFNAYDGAPAGKDGVIKTKVAGSNISLAIVAVNSAGTGVEAGFSGDVQVEIVNSSSGGAVDGNNCNPAWPVIATIPVSATVPLASGTGTLGAINAADSYPNARIRVIYPVGSSYAAATAKGCSVDNFAIRPSGFASFAVTDNDWQTAGLGRALTDTAFGTVLHKAGRPFSVRANAVNAAGTPAITSNYTGAPTATLTACGPGGGFEACTPTFGTLTLDTTFASGQLVSDTASYGNVGSFALQLVDSTFASVDAGDGSTAAEREIVSPVINVGRFVPNHFAVSLNTAPTTPAFGAACAGGFTYLGQAFTYATPPVITVVAKNFADGDATLYAGNWWRITNTSVTPNTQAARYTAATGTLDLSGLPAVASDPVIAATGSGAGTMTFSSGTGLLFARTSPVAPFNAEISLALNVIDADGVSYASNPAQFGVASPGNGIHFTNGKSMRFGRLRLASANGSQLVPLSMLMETQYWNGSSFITNAADSCTSLAAANVGLGNYTGNLAAGETTPAIAGGSFSNGRKTLTLSAPGKGNNGSAQVVLNLGPNTTIDTCPTWSPPTPTPGGANLAFLRGQWCGGTHTKDPTARATFGAAPGAGEVIHSRELLP